MDAANHRDYAHHSKPSEDYNKVKENSMLATCTDLVSNYMCKWKPLVTILCKERKIPYKIQDLMAARFIMKMQRWI